MSSFKCTINNGDVVVCSRSPISVAAAAIYMASQASEDKKSQKGEQLVIGTLYEDLTARTG